MGDEGHCECCGEFKDLPYESRHGVQYCQGCWDWGCTLAPEDACEYLTAHQDGSTSSPEPTDQEVSEAIASIMKDGGW